jgi:hypothetical protein
MFSYHAKGSLTLAMVAALILLSGCGSNIEHIEQAPIKAGKDQTFQRPLEEVWKAAMRVLSEAETFKVLDESGGLMVTEFRTVDAKELGLFETWALGKTYKYSYTINFESFEAGQTNVIVHVKLEKVQWGMLKREESQANVESYLREQLFTKLSERLG